MMSSLVQRIGRARLRLVAWLSTAAGDRERGDVPGWVMITLMTAVLVVIMWGIASDQLRQLLTSAFDKISNQSNAGP